MTPEGWRRVHIGEVASRLGRGMAPTYSSSLSGVFAVNQKCVRAGRVSTDFTRAHDFAKPVKPDAVLQDGDICINSTGTGTIGRVGLWSAPTSGIFFADTHVTVARLCPTAVVPKFFCEALLSPPIQKAMEAECFTGSTNQIELSKSAFAGFEVLLPPLAEQRKIAAILSSLDDAIEASQAVIDQLQIVKRAMMAELLTKGFPGRHKKFKQTEIGQMPEEWGVHSVEDLGAPGRPTAQTGPFGAQLSPRDFTDRGVPVLKIGNVRWGYIDHRDLDFVSEAKAAELARFRVRKGDLLFARQGATTGRNALADDRCEDAIINYHIIRVAVDAQRCLPEWLAICFNSDLVQRQVGREKVRGNRDGINTSNILSFRFPLPGLSEQEQMARAIGEVSKSRVAGETSLEALKQMKSALMSVLLTGEVRVRVDGEVAA